jgi:hypothetical protein
MAQLRSAPHARTVDPCGFPALKDLGYENPSGDRCLDDVNTIVAHLYAGGYSVGEFRVAEEPHSGDLIGFCWIVGRELDLSPDLPNLGAIPISA